MIRPQQQPKSPVPSDSGTGAPSKGEKMKKKDRVLKHLKQGAALIPDGIGGYRLNTNHESVSMRMIQTLEESHNLRFESGMDRYVLMAGSH
jgi:hypothetical protein